MSLHLNLTLRLSRQPTLHLFFRAQASRCSVLGQFDFTGMPPGPKGSAKIEVTFHISDQGVLSVSALDLNTQRHEQWLRGGDMVARV